jgi:prepilin-type N-terminal cleavage/methylation domain-containing protein
MMLTPGTARREHDGGFTLIESIVAMSIFLILFAAFGTAMRAAWNSANINRSAQSATAIGVEHLERARSVNWQELALTHIDDDAPLIDAQAGVLLASEADLQANETLVVASGGLISPWTVEGRDGVEYTVWLYVSEAGDGLRRVLALVAWQVGEADLSHRASTLVSEVASR